MVKMKSDKKEEPDKEEEQKAKNRAREEHAETIKQESGDMSASGSTPQEEFLEQLKKMFAYKSKLSKIIGNELIDNYKELLFHLHSKIKRGELPSHPDYLGGNELAISIYKKKYYLKNIEGGLIEKRPEDVFARISAFVAAVEKSREKRIEWGEKFYRDLYNGHYMPGGRVLAGAGDLYRLKTLANCFVALIADDNIESIYKAAYEAARTYSYGGGIGIDISCLRPRGSIVHNASDKSTGAVSFMELYSLTTGLIGQSGRRGALMLTIDVKHPDVMDFIDIKKKPNWITKQIVEQCKWSGLFSDKQLEEIEKQVMENTQIRFANISLKVSDEFIHAVEEQNRYGRESFLVYKKSDKLTVMEAFQSKSTHYSYGIPSKDIGKYELLKEFKTIDELNSFLADYNAKLSIEELGNPHKRDVFGDYVIETEKSYDLAVRQSGDFLLYFGSENTNSVKRLVKARDVWDLFIEGNYRTAEPGLIFWTAMSRDSPSNYIGRPIAGTNPCAEVPLEDGGACNLGSLNLSRFVSNMYTDRSSINWEQLREANANLVRFLDDVVSWNEILNPLEKQRRAVKETRRIGLGVMGIADMLNQLQLDYDGEKGIKILEDVMRVICNTSYSASSMLAKEKGTFPVFNYNDYSKGPFFNTALDEETKDLIKSNGLRNVAILSIAPTGTISNIALSASYNKKNYIGVSGGIEPIFALYYTRRSESFGNMFFKVFHSTVQAYVDMKNIRDLVENAKDDEELRKVLPPHFFRTAHYIDPEKRVKIQAICQRYIDHSISSTVNLPEDINPEVISNIYLNAWRSHLKGITIYRAGSRVPILSVDSEKTEFQRFKEKSFKVVIDNEEKIVKGDELISLPNGRLSTVYHAIKEGLIKVSPDK